MKDNIYNYMEDYLNFCKSDKSRSRRTLKVYRISISKYIDLLNFDENFPLENIFIASFKPYYDYLFNEGYALSTLKVRIIAVKLFLEYLEGKGIISSDKICDLRSEDVVILDTSIIISVTSLRRIIHKLYIYDAFYISIIKKYFEVTENLIKEIGYFIVNVQSKNKMTEPTLNKIFKDYKFDKGDIPVKITSKFIRDLRLLHLLKNNQNVYYIQQLFDYDIDTLLERVRYFEIYCGLSCNFSTSINIVI